MRVFFLPVVAAVAVMLIPAVSEAGLFRRRDGTPRQPFRTAANWAAPHHCRGGHCQELQPQTLGKERNGPWGIPGSP